MTALYELSKKGHIDKLGGSFNIGMGANLFHTRNNPKRTKTGKKVIR